jgi:hypothetical protein
MRWKIRLPRLRAGGSRITPGTAPGTLVFDGENKDLWWVKVILNAGRPVVAVIVLVMCAPGEQHLARLAGWSSWLAWGMPATLTAYAGIAAVVATKRPKKSPGKKTAVAGAIISVLLAMGAQPISHLYQQGLITGHRIPLTIVISCVPALVFGHLLHMAAAPVGVPATPALTPEEHIAAGFGVPLDMVADGMTEDEQSRMHEGTWRGPGVTEPWAFTRVPPSARRSMSPEPGPDAMRYRPEDEDGMDAGLDALRRPARGFSADLMTGDETVAAAIRDLPDARLEFDARDLEIHRPRPDTDVPDILDRSMSRLIVPAADVPDMWSAPIGAPEPDMAGQPPRPWAPVYGPVRGYRDTETQDTGTGRDTGAQTPSRGVPADTPRTRTRRTTGITAAVRNLIADTPDISDDEIKAALSDRNPDSVRKSINRVRTEGEGS